MKASSFWSDALALCRPKQWLKNAFVFLPIIFALKLHHPELWQQASWVFLAFCFVASSIYCLNDLLDANLDRQHPTKQYRPIASSRIQPMQAKILCGLLAIAGLTTAWITQGSLALALLSLYFCLNLLYCLRMKHVALLDITFVATGFVLRVITGAVATAIVPSAWIILMTFLLALFIALAKRRDDLLLTETNLDSSTPGASPIRNNLDGYNKPFVDSAMLMMAAVVLVGYVQYTVSPEVTQRFGTPWLFVTTLFVVLGLLRYLQLTLVHQATGSPTQVLWTDRFLQGVIVSWLITFIALIYW